MRINYFIVIFLFCILHSFSQNLVFTLIDTMKITIGEPINYSIKLHKKYYNAILINLIQKKLKKHHIDLNSYIIDSRTSKKYIYYNLMLTSFIPGTQIIPAFQWVVNKRCFTTCSYFINVLDIDIHLNKDYKDIKNIEIINFEFIYEFIYFFLKYINYILFFLLCLIVCCVYYFFYYTRNNQRSYIISNFNETIYKINQLKNKNYIEESKFRLFYIEFADIIREHLSSYYCIPAKMLFTEDLLTYIKLNNLVSTLYYEFLLDILKMADAVKFAKFIPDYYVCYQQLEQFISFVNECNQKDENT